MNNKRWTIKNTLFLFHVFLHMLIILSIIDFKAGDGFFRIVRKSYARWRKTGFFRCYMSLSSDYRSAGFMRAPVEQKANVEQKQILFIDESIPSPNVSGGGYAAIQELNIFKKMNFEVSFMTILSSVADGSGQDLLKSMGVDYIGSIDNQQFQRQVQMFGSQFCSIYITRFVVAEKILDDLRWWAPNTKIIFNLADLHYLREARLAINNREPLTSVKLIKARELDVISKSDITLSYSYFERSILEKNSVNKISIGICPWVEKIPKIMPPSFSCRDGIAFLGGFSHQPNVEAVEWFCENVMPLVYRDLPDCKFYIFGHGAKEHLKHIEAYKNVEVVGWVTSVAEVYDNCRVFVAPLRSGAGVKGKVIGALGHGVPSVLSPLAVEGIPAISDFHCCTVISPEDWLKAIYKLYTDAGYWTSVSNNARKLVLHNYSVENGLAEMKKNLQAIGLD